MNLLKTNIIKAKKFNTVQGKNSLKHFPVSTREWNNSIYVYNKNALSLIPVTSYSVTKIIKSYLLLFSNNIEKVLRTQKFLSKRRRISKNKIFIGNSEFKHTNDKVVISLYLFNRQEKNYFIILRKMYNYLKKRKIYSWKEYEKEYNKKNVYWNEYKKFFFVKINYMLYVLNILAKEHEKKKYSITLFENLSNPLLKKQLDKLELSFVKFKDQIIKKVLEKWELYFFYKQLIYINKSKFNYTYLQHLKKYLQTIYNKDIEFNLIKLKRFYLSSDILSESIKLKISKNRRRIFRYLSKLKNKVKTKDKNLLKPTFTYNIKYTTSNFLNKINIRRNILDSIKYKNVSGFRLEAKGRLTRRHTASRSVTKVKYKGNLLNLDSSHRGLSTILLKGNLESNLQYTKLKSKTRIGSYGLKGWVSGN